MLFEDLDVFFEDFGLSCVCNGNEFIGILDAPDESLPMGGGAMLSTMYELTVKASSASGIVSGSSISIESINYKVRAIVAKDDGRIAVLTLSKV